MDITRRKLTIYETASQKGSPINQFTIKHEFPDYKFKDVVRPNVDTYYSIAFLDLSGDALVLSLPAKKGELLAQAKVEIEPCIQR